MKRAHYLILGAVFLSACTEEGETLGDSIEIGEMHLDELRAEVESHHQDAEQATTLTGLQDLEAMHEEMTGGHLDDLDRVRGEMMHCRAPKDSLDSMHDMQQMCFGELERHRDRIRDCTTLEEALQEEGRHRDTMMGNLDGLDETMHGMRMMHGHSMCERAN